MKMFNRRTILFTIIIISLGIVLHILTRSPEKPDKEEEAVQRENEQIVEELSGEEWSEYRVDKSKLKTYEIEKKKFIRDVIIEKDPVCAGEDFKVEVIASNTEGADSELTYRIGRQFGNPVILRFARSGEKVIHIFVRNSRENVDHRKITVRVVDCPDKPYVYLKARFSSDRPDEADFEVAEMRGLSGKCSYRWDFGDGSTLVTQSGFSTHNYGKRKQKQFSSTFIATVTVIDEIGREALGRASISFPNVHWMSSRMGHPIIPVIYNRFPEQKSGLYEVNVTIKNIYDEDIRLKDAQAEFRPCDSTGAPEFGIYGAKAFISKTFLPANGIVNDRLTFSEKMLPPSTCNVIIKLSGELLDGRTVTGSLYLTIPMTAEEALETKRGKVVTDRELIRKIRKARSILGKEVITPAEIRRLELEGKL
jgi:hypothetical protein